MSINESSIPNLIDPDSRTIRILVFIISLLLFITATVLVILSREATAVSAVYGAAVLCLIFTFLPMFKSFKAFGVEAQLNEQKKQIGEIVTEQVVGTNM